ncbi:DNA methyltransferase [Sphingomonas oligophenolica]|uniref:Methyltransferase n=1 Tax=Sphingomonas oligophenolica TaxID=301154 RepID=A0A502CN75_9SPHN|nr:DNA methyltransferase [Sphingomonas oligophenolica]TPG13226.1 site-specific DNA-methyltransferase [Sphingomonas oligophenolica]
MADANRLYYGDNLDVLRTHVADESVDLIYLDPPFNSNASYNILFKSPDGAGADASIEAFDDTWVWGPAAASALMDITESGNHALHALMQAMRSAIGENAMMAYLAMMAVRLIELRRVLKPTGSLYLHCDPTASHYLKLVLDAVFGLENFRNEIIWCYRKWSITQGQFVRNHDTLFFYSKEQSQQVFNTQFVAPSAGTMKRWKGHKQHAVFDADGVRHASSQDGEDAKSAMPDWWDISILNPNAKERLGYPTQKPVALLERIVAASSNPGDIVLDPFCGCGTAVDAAQKLGRRWIGIDITHLAVGLIEKRLREGYGDAVRFDTIGVPRDLASAQRLAADNPHQFQAWITLKPGGWPWMGGKKGGDRGVDGYFYYVAAGGKTETGVISVKAGAHVNPAMVRDLGRVMARDGHKMGLFVCAADPTRGMTEEANSHALIQTEFGRFPALQCFTLEALFDGHHPRLPPLVSPNRRAARVETRESHQPGAQGALI